MDICSRKYLAAEKNLKKKICYKGIPELKAFRLKNDDKRHLYSVLDPYIKFAALINQNKISPHIFTDKKSKQRYLDFAYKLAIKHTLERLIREGYIFVDEQISVHIYADEHSTATNGRYELEESIYHELKDGTTNFTYNRFSPPILKGV